MDSTCFCGVVLEGDDMDALVAAGVTHFDSVHPDLQLIEVQIRNYLEGELRIDGPTERLEEVGDIVVKPVSAETREDIIEFFNRRAFADNPPWGMCFCMYHHIGGDATGPWPHRRWQDNRSDLSDRIDAGTTTGVVAYVGGELAGFCNASGRNQFPDKNDGDETVGSIVCFVVAPPYRGHGVSKALLAGAIDRLADLGFDYAEGYPKKDPESAADAFVGTLAMFEREGFEVVSDEPLRVRKALV